MKGLQRSIAALTETVRGRIGVCVRDIESGKEIGINLDEPLPMASVCKVPILVTAYRKQEAGELDLAERIELTEGCRCFGSGLLNAFDTGLRPTLRDLMLLMIVVSDNAATDLVLERVGGAPAVAETMRVLGLPEIGVERNISGLLGDYFIALEPGLRGMKFGEWDARCADIPGLKERGDDLNVVRDAVNVAAAERDTATPRAMARLLAQIAKSECAGETACAAMVEILNKQQLNARLPRDLPVGAKFPHKTGTLGSGAVVNDAGLLYRDAAPVAAVAVFSRDVRDPIADTQTTLARIGRAVYDAYYS